MTWSILCNLFFLYNKKRHGRILFFHTYYLLLYSTRYTFFSIICVSCTYFPLRVNWIHSIHAYHLYLILHLKSEVRADAARLLQYQFFFSVRRTVFRPAGSDNLRNQKSPLVPAIFFQTLFLLFHKALLCFSDFPRR